jgi:hypothetical protein
MSTRNGGCFDGSTSLLEIHDDIQVFGDNGTWFIQFSPVIEGRQKRIAEAILWLFYTLGMCV